MSVATSVGAVRLSVSRCFPDRILTVFLSVLWIVFGSAEGADAQSLTASNVQIQWKVDNRFRLFRDASSFQLHEAAWRQYKSHVEAQALSPEERQKLVQATSVIGAEHVLNDRYIPFTQHLRSKYDWRGWAAQQYTLTCWNPDERMHSACGGVSNYLNPASHGVTAWLSTRQEIAFLQEKNCEWRVNGGEAVVSPCDEPVSLSLPYADGGTIAVNVEGESAISTDAKVRDLLIVGMGDSFASGEGNPDRPVVFSNTGRFRNVYPKRAVDNVSGNAQWTDELCHRSLYSHQLRTALQIAVENAQMAVTFLGYACSGAAIDDGILGPQAYVKYVASGVGNGDPVVAPVSGGRRDMQIYWLLRELCVEKPEREDSHWICPQRKYRRNVDFLLLSIGGNDIGFRDLVTWVSLRESTSASLAGLLGATISAPEFARNMRDILPGAFARLARALELAVPLPSGDLPFDSSRVILTAYPDILVDEAGRVCQAGEDGDDEDQYPANQSLDAFSSWLAADTKKLAAAHAQLEQLHKRMFDLATDHGWTFAGRAYEDRPFRGRGFCAQDKTRIDQPTEQLIMPCWGKAPRPTATCSVNLSGKERSWRPYDPQNETYPYALRQRWVRTFNDAYLVVNEKVTDRQGRVLNDASQRVFSETTGAMHPSAEGQAAMADAILLDLRAVLSEYQPSAPQ